MVHINIPESLQSEIAQDFFKGHALFGPWENLNINLGFLFKG